MPAFAVAASLLRGHRRAAIACVGVSSLAVAAAAVLLLRRGRTDARRRFHLLCEAVDTLERFERDALDAVALVEAELGEDANSAPLRSTNALSAKWLDFRLDNVSVLLTCMQIERCSPSVCARVFTLLQNVVCLFLLRPQSLVAVDDDNFFDRIANVLRFHPTLLTSRCDLRRDVSWRRQCRTRCAAARACYAQKKRDRLRIGIRFFTRRGVFGWRVPVGGPESAHARIGFRASAVMVSAFAIATACGAGAALLSAWSAGAEELACVGQGTPCEDAAFLSVALAFATTLLNPFRLVATSIIQREVFSELYADGVSRFAATDQWHIDLVGARAHAKRADHFRGLALCLAVDLARVPTILGRVGALVWLVSDAWRRGHLSRTLACGVIAVLVETASLPDALKHALRPPIAVAATMREMDSRIGSDVLSDGVSLQACVPLFGLECLLSVSAVRGASRATRPPGPLLASVASQLVYLNVARAPPHASFTTQHIDDLTLAVTAARDGYRRLHALHAEMQEDVDPCGEMDRLEYILFQLAAFRRRLGRKLTGSDPEERQALELPMDSEEERIAGSREVRLRMKWELADVLGSPGIFWFFHQSGLQVPIAALALQRERVVPPPFFEELVRAMGRYSYHSLVGDVVESVQSLIEPLALRVAISLLAARRPASRVSSEEVEAMYRTHFEARSVVLGVVDAAGTVRSCLQTASRIHRVCRELPITIDDFAETLGEPNGGEALNDATRKFADSNNQTRRRLPVPRLRHSIEFRDVRFAYATAPNKVVLDSISFVLPARSFVGIVGPTGHGKSTVAKLLQRLYDPTPVPSRGSLSPVPSAAVAADFCGQVLFDGVPFTSLRTGQLRRAIVVVPQLPQLLDGTFFQNISLGLPGVTMEAVVRAAKQAFCHDFISCRPLGYETMVDREQVELSDGEVQRVALARAFLLGAQVLVLDEATSRLDAESEKRIHQALTAFRQGEGTVVCIAHRLSTLAEADHVVCIENGRCTAQGTPHALLQDPQSVLARFMALQHHQQPNADEPTDEGSSQQETRPVPRPSHPPLIPQQGEYYCGGGDDSDDEEFGGMPQEANDDNEEEESLLVTDDQVHDLAAFLREHCRKTDTNDSLAADVEDWLATTTDSAP